MNSIEFYYKKDRLNQLRGFCAVVDTGSVNKAAAAIGVEPTTVSKQIRSLERDLKLNLFTRGERKKSLTLTENGSVFHAKAVDALRGIEGLFDHFYNEIEEKNSKEIRVAAHHTVLCYMLPNYVKKYKQIYKDIKFKLVLLPIDKALEALNERTIDLVLYPIQETYPGYDCKFLYDLDPMILVSKNNELASKREKEITFKDLSKQNLLLMDKNKILMSFVEYCSKMDIGSNIEFDNVNWETMRNYVKLDLGIHLYSELYNVYINSKCDDIVAKNVSHLFPRILMYSIMKHGKVPSPELKQFIDIIEDDPLLQC